MTPSEPAPSTDDTAPKRMFEKDPRPYRATYGTLYPTVDRTFATKADVASLAPTDGGKARLSSTKLFWVVSGASVLRASFRECSFHNTRGASATLIHELTFEECDFTQCFLGFVLFRRTTFRKCKFARCEMSRTEFEDCTFEDCTFRDCTPWDVVFQRTLVQPEAFLDGFLVPSEHLTELSADEQAKIADRHVRATVGLAEQLLRSNEERRNALYCDRALFRVRQATAKLRAHELREKSGFAWAAHLVRLLISYAYLFLTKGGTSLSRLIALAAIACVSVSAMLLNGLPDVTIQGVAADSLSFPKCLGAAVSLFLAFGYTNFATSTDVGALIVATIPVLGLTWSALVFAVLVRRAYR